MQNPEKYSQNNIVGTLNILNSLSKYNIEIFVLSSTAAVYGYPEYLPIDENHSLHPINYYGYTKLVIEENLKWFSNLQGINYACLRYFNAAGYDINGRIRGKEKIYLDNLKFRHFVTNSKNELYEDINGDIYVSADRKGIYKLSFINFIN